MTDGGAEHGRAARRRAVATTTTTAPPPPPPAPSTATYNLVGGTATLRFSADAA